MSVMLETSLGELVIDLEVDKCPKTCENFLKLCKVKYYNLNAFFNVSKNFICQTGDPTASGTGGESFASYNTSLLTSSSTPSTSPSRYFVPDTHRTLKHTARGTVSMAVSPSHPPGAGSQFFITLAPSLDYLDERHHSVFGHVIEGFETLDKINEAFLDKDGRPLQDIRIRHVEVLEDPFPDPEGMMEEPQSPVRPPDLMGMGEGVARIGEDEDVFRERDENELELERRRTAAASSALTLEMIGDLPFANVKVPEATLFVCKLNPITTDDDLHLIFSRFGDILSCEVIRDKTSGDSLQYAFIEFSVASEAEAAYFKMQNVLIDDRRIWVDFSQSVAKGFDGIPGGVGGMGGGRGGRGGRGGGRGCFGGRGGGGGGDTYMAPRGGGAGRGRDSGYGSRGGSSGGGGGGGGGYGMVFDKEPSRSSGGDRERERERRKSRSPRRDRDRDRDEEKRYRRERSGSRDRKRDSHGHGHGSRRRDDRDDDRDRRREKDERDRPREKDRDRERYRERSRDRSRDRSRR